MMSSISISRRPAGHQRDGLYTDISDYQMAGGIEIPSALNIDEAVNLPNLNNVHVNLQKILDKFEVDKPFFNSILKNYDKSQLHDLQKQLKLIKFAINNSMKTIFNVDSLQDKYPLVAALIKEQKMDNIELNESKNKNDQPNDTDSINYNEIMKNFKNPKQLNLSISEILRFQSAVNIKTRSNNSTNEINKLYNEQLKSRDMVEKDSNRETFVTKKSNKFNSSMIVSKSSLLSIINDLESKYNIINEQNKWKEHIEYVKKTIKESLEKYCQASRQYEKLSSFKKQIDKWIIEHDKLISMMRKELDDPKIRSDYVEDMHKFEKMMMKKYEDDQIFLMNTIGLLNMDKVKKEMEAAGKIFTMHYQFVENLVGSFIKENICKICMNHTADMLIDKCRHLVCVECSKSLISINYTARCPYCNQEFNGSDLKKIYY